MPQRGMVRRQSGVAAKFGVTVDGLSKRILAAAVLDMLLDMYALLFWNEPTVVCRQWLSVTVIYRTASTPRFYNISILQDF